MVLPGCCVAEALSCGYRGVSHSGCGEEDSQVLNGAPQTFSLHLEQTKRKGGFYVGSVFLVDSNEGFAIFIKTYLDAVT